MTATPTCVTVFDLDGTITRRDTLVPYLVGWARRNPRRLPGLAAVPVYLFAFLLDGGDRGQLKSRLLQRFMARATRAEIDAWTRLFVDSTLERLLCRRTRDRIEEHRRRGDHLVLLSASVDLYVPAIGTALGFADVVCTGTTWRGDRLEGYLATPNRRGLEKAHVIDGLRARFPSARFVAYGNAGSDIPHLQRVDEPCLVNASRHLRRSAAESGWRCEDWR